MKYASALSDPSISTVLTCGNGEQVVDVEFV
jgi:hypothetical protein